MQFDIHHKPDPLSFGEGDDAFKLMPKAPTGAERAAILDACDAGSYAEIQHAIERIIVGWDGVADPEGRPVPFETQDGGTVKKLLNDFLGAVPLAVQIKVIAGVLAFVGVPTGDVERLVKVFEQSDLEPGELDPTTPPDSATPTSASGG